MAKQDPVKKKAAPKKKKSGVVKRGNKKYSTTNGTGMPYGGTKKKKY